MQVDNQTLAGELAAIIPPERIYTDEIRRRALSVDASMFFRQARVVVDLVDEEEVIALLSYAGTRGVGVTFRAAGTSLNGQCSGTGILARLRGRFWRRLEVQEQGKYIKGWCGVPGPKLNEALAPFKRIIGPDPASLAAANFGGILANNAAGMCCTVRQNSYATMRHMRLILADGTVLDTSDRENVEKFRISHKKILDELSAIRLEILEDRELAARIQRKYAIKNTCGYSVNSFVDFHDPVDILTHLMIGSEGTLGFVANAGLATIESYTHRATAIIFFADLKTGARAVSRWHKSNSANAAELWDGPSLRAMSNLPQAPAIVKGLEIDACGVLIEARAADEQELRRKIESLSAAIEDIETLGPYEFYTDEERCEALWAFRRAQFPAIAGAREPNELVIIEDVCFPIDKIEEGCREFSLLFDRYGYEGGVHGHAFHGNFHFALPVDMSSEQQKSRVHAFLEEMMHMVVKFDGSLKAEHGTGYAVAPFVELEWGTKLFSIMRRVKRLLDPANILNPGVLLNDDPKCHMKNLKNPVAAHPKLDNCVECGFCESVCPSEQIGLSPRQRVSVWRHISHLRATEPEKTGVWEKGYDELGTELCATDGLCTTRCPLQVDVAGFVRDRRALKATARNRKAAHAIGSHFSTTTRSAALLLNGVALFQKLLGDALMYKAASTARKLSGRRLPAWNEQMPRGAKKPARPTGEGVQPVVYVPSCAIRTMGDSVHDPAEPLAEVTVRVLERAGYRVIIPEKIEELCCGKAFETKGLFEEADAKSREMEAALLRASEDGKFPIMCETSPCLARMKKVMDKRLNMYEPVEFTLKFLSARLTLKKLSRRIAVHPTCSTRLLGLAEPLFELAGRCAEDVVWPRDIHCCGFSGDKGFSHPELNRSVLETLAEQISGCDVGYSTSRTCEIGLSLHGKVPYRSIMYLLDECSADG